MYSQNNEETVVLNLFQGRPPGRFLDIGAYDGKTYSNTLRLAELGWRGVCVEPSPIPFSKLLALHGSNERIELINAAISLNDGWVDFFDCGFEPDDIGTVSSLDARHQIKWSTVNFKRYTIYALAVGTLFERTKFDFDFINLDVEGTNIDLFLALPLHEMASLTAICVEHDSYNDRMLKHAAQFGFRQVAVNGENLILAR